MFSVCNYIQFHMWYALVLFLPDHQSRFMYGDKEFQAAVLIWNFIYNMLRALLKLKIWFNFVSEITSNLPNVN